MFRREAQSLIRKGSTPEPSLHFKQTSIIRNVIKKAIDSVVIIEPHFFDIKIDYPELIVIFVTIIKKIEENPENSKA